MQFEDDEFSLMEFATNTLNGVTINGSSEREELFGSSGNDTIYGNGGEDQIFGGSGDDEIFAQDMSFTGSGQDWTSIWGGVGSDLIYFTNPTYSGVMTSHLEKKALRSTIIRLLRNSVLLLVHQFKAMKILVALLME